MHNITTVTKMIGDDFAATALRFLADPDPIDNPPTGWHISRFPDLTDMPMLTLPSLDHELVDDVRSALIAAGQDLANAGATIIELDTIGVALLLVGDRYRDVLPRDHLANVDSWLNHARDDLAARDCAAADTALRMAAEQLREFDRRGWLVDRHQKRWSDLTGRRLMLRTELGLMTPIDIGWIDIENSVLGTRLAEFVNTVLAETPTRFVVVRPYGGNGRTRTSVPFKRGGTVKLEVVRVEGGADERDTAYWIEVVSPETNRHGDTVKVMTRLRYSEADGARFRSMIDSFPEPAGFLDWFRELPTPSAADACDE